ncbi:MAG: hypothetical protein AAF362_04135 [Pseudomonadota bacterium]
MSDAAAYTDELLNRQQTKSADTEETEKNGAGSGSSGIGDQSVEESDKQACADGGEESSGGHKQELKPDLLREFMEFVEQILLGDGGKEAAEGGGNQMAIDGK